MTTDVILPFAEDCDGLLDAMTYYGIRLVYDFTNLPESAAGVWQIEGDPEMVDKFVNDHRNMIAYC